MHKIPTVYLRDPQDRSKVTDQVNPECQWVLDGLGTPTHKYDGTCVMYDGQRWWARREVKPGKNPPPNYLALHTDPNTGKTVGWEPIEQSGYAKMHAEALVHAEPGQPWRQGTYELVGPKVNGNPERLDEHLLVGHASAAVFNPEEPNFFDDPASIVRFVGKVYGWEGVVWHHVDGVQMAKLKARDL